MILVLMLLAADGPKATLEKTTNEVRAIVAEKATLAAKQKKMKVITQRMIDFDKVAEATLGAEWAKMSPKDRKAFAATLEQLVEASYINKVSEANSVDIAFTAEEGSTVEATAKAQGADVHLKFSMDGGKVRDVEIDDVSLVRNYKSQFARVIAKSGVKELQAKIQKKADELKSNGTQSEAIPTRTK